jgi:hypothetical protein
MFKTVLVVEVATKNNSSQNPRTFFWQVFPEIQNQRRERGLSLNSV